MPLTAEEELQAVELLGGRPGDKLVQNPDGRYVIAPGATQQGEFQFTGKTNDPVGAQRIAQGITGPESLGGSKPAMALGNLARQSAGQPVITPMSALALNAVDAIPGLGAATAAGMLTGAIIPNKAIGAIAAIPAAIAGSYGMNKLQEHFRSPKAQMELDLSRQQQPIPAAIGGLIPSAVTGKVGLDSWRSAGRMARNVAAMGPTEAGAAGLLSGDLANTANLGVGLAMPGVNAYKEYQATGKINPATLALNAAAGALITDFNNPTKRVVNAAAGRPIMHVGNGYTPQSGEMLRRGMDAQTPLNVKPTPDDPTIVPTADTVSPDARKLGYKDPDELASDIATGREKVQTPTKDYLKMEQQRRDAANSLGTGDELSADRASTQANNLAVDAVRTPGIDASAVDAIVASDITPAEKTAKLMALFKEVTDKGQNRLPIPVVPDNPATVREQLNLTRDPNSSRAATLLTPGTKDQPVPLGLRRLTTRHGDVIYNPNKTTQEAVAQAAQGEDFDATLLGFAHKNRPHESAGDPDVIAVTAKSVKGDVPNVQAEATNLEQLPAALAAAERANPGGQIEVKTQGDVINERLTPAEQRAAQRELDAANRSEKGFGEDEITGIVGEKNKPKLLGGVTRTLANQGNQVDVQPETGLYTTPEDSTPRFGRQQGNNVEVGLQAHAAPHEAVHAVYESLSPTERASLDDVIINWGDYQRARGEDPGLSPKEYLAQRGSVELVRQIQNKDFGLWKDLGMQARRLFGIDTPQDAMRFIGNVFSGRADRPGGSLNVKEGQIPQRPPGPAGTYRRYPETESEGASPKADAPQTDAEASYSRGAAKDTPAVPEDFETSDNRGIGVGDHRLAVVDRITNPQLRQSANEAMLAKQQNLGYGYDAFRKNKDAIRSVNLDAMADAFNAGDAPLQDASSQKVYDMFRQAADWINSKGPARDIEPKEGYVPQMFHPDVRTEFKKSTSSPTAVAIKEALVEHYAGGMKRAEAVEAVNDLARAIHENATYDPSTDFGPLHKAAGLGLPASVHTPTGEVRIRDNDAQRVVQNYFARAATDLAYHNAITKRFGENGGETSDAAFQRWRQQFTKQPETDADQLLRSGMRAASSVVVSTLSGLRNITNLPQQAAAFTGKYGPFTTLAALKDTLVAPKQSYNEAVAQGHIRPGQNDMAFGKDRDTNIAAKVLDEAANLKRMVDGSTALETLSRMWSHNIGKRAAANMIEAGDRHKMLRLGVQPSDPEAQSKLAASIASHIEGTYDGRELPGFMLEGKLGSLLSIHKWSVEKMNSAYKDLYVPATKGDLWPLVWTAAIAAGVTIPAMKGISQAVSGKKGAPELNEIEAAEKIDGGGTKWMARASWLTQLLSLASIAGYASQAANVAAQSLQGDKGQHLVFVPLDELASKDLGELVSNTAGAIRKGETLDTIGPQFGKNLLKIFVQGSQGILNRLPGAEGKVQRASDARDFAVYENLVNDKTKKESSVNDLDGALEREFKLSDKPPEAKALLKKILQHYREEYKDDPFMRNAKLRSLREMNIGTFPAEGRAQERYYKYLRAAYGDIEAKAHANRADQIQALNKRKVTSIDMSGGKPAEGTPSHMLKE